MVVHHRHVDGAHLIEGVLGIDVGAALDEQLDHLDPPLVGGIRQRGGAVSGFGVDVGPVLERARHAGDISVARGVPELFIRGSASLGRRRLRRCGALGLEDQGQDQ